MNNMNHAENKFEMSPEALAQLGDGRIAYVKTIRSEDVQTLFPQADVPQMAPGQKLFALHAADGTPIMLTVAKPQSPMPGVRSWRRPAYTDQEPEIRHRRSEIVVDLGLRSCRGPLSFYPPYLMTGS